MNILYIDPVFGLSGDMMISALIDAGLPFEELDQLYKKIPLPIPAIRPEKKKQGIVEGIHLHIDASPIHLNVPEMEQIIEKIDEKGRVKEDARVMLRILLEAEAKVHFLKDGMIRTTAPDERPWGPAILTQVYDTPIETIPFGERSLVIPK
jgi:pyridinium-3,5-bisthiocarboxylic acid mononucleotide nickel chelatase